MFYEPMLLEKIDKPFDDPDRIYEPKIDGHRLELSSINGHTKLFTRHKNECTAQYPELLQIPIDADIILDGEVYCVDANGKIDFELVMSRFQTKGEDRIAAAAKRLPVGYMVFDILQYKGQDLRGLSLMRRKEILHEVLPDTTHISKIQFIEKEGNALFAAIKQNDLEGIVIKKKNSTYVGKRSSDWLKVINYQYAEVFLSGYKKNEFGWLASIEENGKIRPAGIIELGVPPKHKKAFYGVSQSIVTGEDRDFVYLQPAIKATVKFRNWTRSGMLRSPVFVDFVLPKSA